MSRRDWRTLERREDILSAFRAGVRAGLDGWNMPDGRMLRWAALAPRVAMAYRAGREQGIKCDTDRLGRRYLAAYDGASGASPWLVRDTMRLDVAGPLGTLPR